MSPAERAETIKLPFAYQTRLGPMNHVGPITWGPDANMGRNNFEAKQANHIGTLYGHLCKHG